MKNDMDAIAKAKEGETWIRSLNAPDARVALPYLASSPNADAWLIGAWSVYHTGQIPSAMRPSRGNSWKLDLPGTGEVKVKIINAYDHREGIKVLGGLA